MIRKFVRPVRAAKAAKEEPEATVAKPDKVAVASATQRYFGAPSKNLQFISTGCQVLDCALGGGYPLGRMANIIGDKSTGKTLLAIEACNNFNKGYPKGHIWYNEVEAAFDTDYAAALGLPVEDIEFSEDCFTVEAFAKDLEKCIEQTEKSKQPGLYILDSLDALSDAAEMEREIDEKSFGAAKAKKMSELFRKLVKKLKKSNIALLIISQVRDNIGVTFGEKYTRNGGKAMDFYASQCLWLAQIEKLDRTIGGIKRITGVKIKANCKKNKIGLPFRECTFDIRFGFGIDDVTANVEYLQAVKKLSLIGVDDDKVTRFLRSVEELDDEAYTALRSKIAMATQEVWTEVETLFLPSRRKYAKPDV